MEKIYLKIKYPYIIIMKMQTQIELLNIIGCLVLFENDIYKIDRVT